MQRQVTILIDTREQRPLPFPQHLPVWNPHTLPTAPKTMQLSVTTRRVTLRKGDYALEGREGDVVIERKKNLDELHKNLCTREGRRRFLSELDELRRICRFPHVLVEGDPLELNASVRHTRADPAIVRDALLRCCLEKGVTLLMMPAGSVSARRAFAEWTLALLVSGQLIPVDSQIVELTDPPPNSPFPVPLPIPAPTSSGP